MRVEGVRLSLWRAAAVYRVVTLVACLYLILVRWQDLYARPAVADAAAAGMTAVTVAIVWLAWTGRAHRPAVVVTDVVLSGGLTLLTVWAQTAAQRHGGMTTLTTLWAGGPTLEAGILAGWAGGLAAAVVQGAVSVVVRAGYDGRTTWNVVTLIVAGTVVGYVSRVAVRSEAELAAAVAARAELLERERLARTVHDGVLQVLGLVHRTGRDEPGRWGQLAREAGEQEGRLRALITSRGEPDTLDDLGAALRALRSDRVTVSAPAQPPPLSPHAATEVVAAVRAALHNVDRHAGPDAHAWVFVEDLDDHVRVTVRDDGAGFVPGRLDDAERDGRLGVASSVRGRITGLGGTVEVTSRPGQGTVVEMVIPMSDACGANKQNRPGRQARIEPGAGPSAASGPGADR